jgi:hypothetical protein
VKHRFWKHLWLLPELQISLRLHCLKLVISNFEFRISNFPGTGRPADPPTRERPIGHLGATPAPAPCAIGQIGGKIPKQRAQSKAENRRMPVERWEPENQKSHNSKSLEVLLFEFRVSNFFRISSVVFL